MSNATSPASSGPAGAHFEGQVGASYLLAMLANGEPRGLPGTTIDRVEFQRAAEGYPLDDVIVHAHDSSGHAATLEVQVKRGVKFSPKDEVFKDVVDQIAEASKKPEFWSNRHELGIAISRSSNKIDGPYQDVLTWAREIGDAKTFFERLNRPGSGNSDMREFVSTFRTHLAAAGAASDDETVWKLLRRLHIFVFDYTASGSIWEQLAKERAVRALHPDDGLRAGELWKSLTELAMDIAKSGGDRTREQLMADLVERTFRLAGDRHNLRAREALAEASGYTLADISDRVAGVILTRPDRANAVHAALDEGSYVEIRGNAGVGKSGVLKHFAKQIAAQAAVVAFSPTRTIGKGWLTLRGVLGFDGNARDLLVDLAASGSAVLFIDGLDFFGAEERLTVIDLVREAASIPGMSVIVTARRDFGAAEPNWLPSDALDKLGRAKPVMIDELSADEADELRGAAPQLTALLSEGNPARDVAQNLYRLSRLASRPSEAPTLRTEAEMAEEWWQSADGAKDARHRDRARVLKNLATQALGRADHLTVAGLPAEAVDALIGSESLRDLEIDRVAFRHDVLREWAIANLLFSDPSLLAQLPLTQPATPDLSRGLELAARLSIERTPDAGRWQSLYEAVNKSDVHESWGRAVVLALVRSEVSQDVLNKTSAILFADRGRILRELIRIVIAVESKPADDYYAALGVEPSKIPAGVTIPSGPTWLRLIMWLLSVAAQIPPSATPDVVSLFFNWSMVFLGRDALSPIIIQWFYYWLGQLQAPPQVGPGQERIRPFNGELSSGEMKRMADDLRTGFLLFCNLVPNLAADYLNKLKVHPYRDNVMRELLKFRGTLAQAAPKELAELTEEYLFPKEDDEEDDYDGPFADAFRHADLNFVPASPAQGPFHELLLNAPQYALPLIRRIVDRAIEFRAKGQDYGKDVMVIVYPDGREILFPWHRSYGWSRDIGSGPAVVTSALMALEAWAHARIEKGEEIDKVLADVIGQSPVPAAYLLVAVDLLLSHWPKSQEAAIPFVACPELLCIDSQRLIGDSMKVPDLLGLGELQREPTGIVSLEGLKSRRSRRLSLDRLLVMYANDEYSEGRAVLTDLLQRAVKRLGPPSPASDLGDAEFMVLHALNVSDPKNWRDAIIQTQDGPKEVREYVPPAAETDHLRPLQQAIQERNENAQMEAAIRTALNDAARSSPAFAVTAIKWAQGAENKPAESETAQSMRDEAVVTAALIAARDGGSEVTSEHGEWMRETFARVFREPHDPVHRARAGLHFNRPAIAFVGTALLLKNRFDMADVRTLLEAAGDNAGTAQGFYFVVQLLAKIDERLPRAILRCAFTACVQPWRQWDQPEEVHKQQLDERRGEILSAIGAEVAWLEGKQDEPAWPPFDPTNAHARRRLSLGEIRMEREEKKDKTEQYTDHQAAALWLGKAADIFDVKQRPWLRDLAKAYSIWTKVANGAELDEDDDPDRIPLEWNNAYFNLLASCLPGLTIPQIGELALDPILELPGEAFLDVTTIFVRSLDAVFFNGTDLGAAEAAHIRTALARQVIASRQWGWQRRDRSDSITTHLGPAVAILAFNDYGHFQPTKCYLLPKGIERLGPFLPALQELAEGGPFLFMAMVLLNLLEVYPQPSQLPLICAALKSWLAAYPDDRGFWIEHSIGRRTCAVVSAILKLDAVPFGPGQQTRQDLDEALSKLIRLGVPEAHKLEEALREMKSSKATP